MQARARRTNGWKKHVHCDWLSLFETQLDSPIIQMLANVAIADGQHRGDVFGIGILIRLSFYGLTARPASDRFSKDRRFNEAPSCDQFMSSQKQISLVSYSIRYA